MRFASALVLGLLILGLVACGADEEETASPTATTGTTATGEPSPTPAPPPTGTVVKVYLFRDGKLAATSRLLPQGTSPARAALEQLFLGMAPNESNTGLTNAVAQNTIEGLEIRDGVAVLDTARRLRPGEELAQVVYTLTQFPSVKRVSIVLETNDSMEVSRADVEEFAPPILVETPTPGDEVTSPIRVRGTANTFEANFQLELVDQRGKVAGKRFVTATSGTGTRGTFDVTLPYSAARPGLAELVAYEDDAADGSRKNIVRIPIVLAP